MISRITVGLRRFISTNAEVMPSVSHSFFMAGTLKITGIFLKEAGGAY
jgi:hypothetical protein